MNQADGIPRVEPWGNAKNVTVPEDDSSAASAAYEPIELLSDLGFKGARLPSGCKFKVRLKDLSDTIRICDCLWLNEAQGGQAFRILRESPLPKAIALNQKAQSSLLRKIWDELHPGEPLGAWQTGFFVRQSGPMAQI